MYVPHERRALILRLLEQRGYLRSAALAEELGVTDETIRTDIIALHEQKLLMRVHGGARYILPTGGAEDASRLDCQLMQALLRHLSAGLRLYVDPEPLARPLLPALAELGCHLITPSPALLLAASAPALTLRASIPGGELHKPSRLIAAEVEQASRFMQELAPDVALLLPPALPAPDAAAYHHELQATWAAAAAAAAKRTIVVAPAHAFYTPAAHLAPCSPSLLISEDNLPVHFEGRLPIELIPYLSPADLIQSQ